MIQKKILWGLTWLLVYIPSFSQNNLTVNEAVEAALKNSPALKVAHLVVRQNEQLVRSARNIPNPELVFDSPSGVFYTLGVQQNFRFPTVYTQQAKLQQQQVVLAQKEKTIAENDLKLQVFTNYLNVQYTEARLHQLQTQDSLFGQIAMAAKRNFEVGTTDKLVLTMAEMQATDVKNQVMMADQAVSIAKEKLILLTGISSFNVSSFVTYSNSLQRIDLNQNPTIEAVKQIETLSQNAIQVEKANTLPSFMVGYYNQGSREANLGLRWRVGVSVPLWAGQYKSRVSAAQTGLEVARQQTEAQTLALTSDFQSAKGELVKFQNALNFYENTALQQANSLIEMARRFFESGQTDFITLSKTTNDAYKIKFQYLDTQYQYNQSALIIKYLTGYL